MAFKTALHTFLLAGLICSVTWLSADEPVTPPKSDPPADADVRVLLKRIDQLEQRVHDLEQKVAQLSAKQPILGPAPRQIPQPDSPFLKDLPPQEINGIRYYHVPLESGEQ